MIRLTKVSKRYRDVVALRDVSLEVRKGEVFGYIGPNGAGKTTSIKIITGLVREFGGTAEIGDGNGDPAPGTVTVGYVPQESGFQEWRTVEHVLSTFGRLSGLQGESLARSINHVLAITGIGEFRKRRVVHLSGGTIQKLRIAQALLGDPSIVVLDEPLSGLDPASRHQVKSIIRGLAGEDRVILLSSHILSDVEDLATRIGIIHRGTLREVGTPSELRERHRIGRIVEVVAADPAERDRIRIDDPLVERTEPIGSETLRFHLRPESDLYEGMRLILRQLTAFNAAVRSVHHLQPSLEEVYLKMTEEAS